MQADLMQAILSAQWPSRPYWGWCLTLSFWKQKPCGSLSKWDLYPWRYASVSPHKEILSMWCVGRGVQKPVWSAGSECGWGWLCWSSLVTDVSCFHCAIRVSTAVVPLSTQALPRTRDLLCEGPVFSPPVAAQTQCCPVTWRSGTIVSAPLGLEQLQQAWQ